MKSISAIHPAITENTENTLVKRALGLSLFCLFSTYFFYPAILLFFTYFAQYFAHYLAIFLLIQGFFLVYLQLLSMHDCCIRVIHNMVTALLEYLDLIAVFPVAYVVIILFATILVEYFHLCNAK